MNVWILIAMLVFVLGIIVYLLLTCEKKCEPDCDGKVCGDSDGCTGVCMKCDEGVCDGKVCKKVGGTKGIFYFDVDGTITTSKDFEGIVQKCLKNNIAVGIITNSPRTVESLCTGNKAGGTNPGSNTWMSSTLCKQFNDNGARMFNSTVLVAGSKDKPPGWSQNISPGYTKAFDMNYGRNKFYPDIPDRCVVLFDDDPGYLEGVVDYNKRNNTNFGMVCANTSCGGKKLDIELVGKVIDGLDC